MSEEVVVEGTSEVADEPESHTRRRLIAMGGAAAGAVAMAGFGPGTAQADDCDGLDVIKDAPVNAKLPAFLTGDPEDPSDMGDALEAAVLYADTNGLGVVLVPAGAYAVDGLQIPAGVQLIGEGPLTVLTCAAPSYTAVRLVGDDAGIADLKITGDQSGSVSTGIEGAVSVEAKRCIVRRVEVSDARRAGVSISDGAEGSSISDCSINLPTYYGIVATIDASGDDSEGLSIFGNDIVCTSSDANGIAFTRTGSGSAMWGGIRVASNSVAIPVGSDSYPILLGTILTGSVQRATLTGNVVSGGSAGIAMSQSTYITVSGNTFSECALGVLSVNASGFGGFQTIVGNTMSLGTASESAAGVGIIGADGGAVGFVVSGNSIKGFASGVITIGEISSSITGNFIESTDDDEVYEAEDEAEEDEKQWAGISVAPNEGDVGETTIVGNHIDGNGVLPIGIKLHNSPAATVNGNLVRNCVGESEGESRDILVRMNDEDLVDDGKATAGAIVGNQAYVSVSTDSGGAVGDLRVSANRQAALPEVDTALDLVLAGLPEIVSVNPVGVFPAITRILHFNAGSAPTALTYPGRKVTLRFTGVVLVVDGSNLNLNDHFVTAAGSTLALVSDGTNWNEVSRTL